jgi:hypothetical protein
MKQYTVFGTLTAPFVALAHNMVDHHPRQRTDPLALAILLPFSWNEDVHQHLTPKEGTLVFRN